MILISEESYTTYNLLLSEVVGASNFPAHSVAPLREVIGAKSGVRFVMGAVMAVDIAERTLPSPMSPITSSDRRIRGGGEGLVPVG